MKKLLIVESPAKIKTISKFLGKDFKIMSTVGHIMDLPERKLGVTMDKKKIELEYVPIKDKEKVIQGLVAEAKRADEIYLAPDPDREGEIIAWHVEQAIISADKKHGAIHRITFNEITKKAIEEAIARPHEVDMKMVSAQQARRVLDRWVGYEVSPVLWRKIQKGLSAGRVQSVALKIICDREEEIRAFKPQEYWTIDGLFKQNSAELQAQLAQIDKKKPEISSKEQADALLKELDQADYTVSAIEDKQRSRSPLAPFMTSTLQQAAYNTLGFAVKRTMQVAQNLYEGIPLEESDKPVALITYMRTDSLKLSDTAIGQARSYIESKIGKNYLPDSANVFERKGKAVAAQEAHEAIRPIDVTITPDYVRRYAEPEQAKLYELIWKRTVASQMKPALYAQRQVTIKNVPDKNQAKEFIFKVTGSTLIFDGFLKVYNAEEDENKEEGKVSIPKELKANAGCDLKKLDPKQHFTQPPPRFTEASLVKDLEKEGIGRPSTYATILNTIRARAYTTLDPKKRFIPSELGMTVSKMLTEHLPKIMNIKFTAEMEEDLDKIADGEMKRDELLRSFYQEFERELDAFRGEAKRPIEKTDITCPLCHQGKLLIRFGKAGSFLGCERYPDCTFTSNFKRDEAGNLELIKAAAPEMLDIMCELCGKPLRKLMGKFGPFVSCSGYPECKYIHQEKAPFKCPLDGGDVIKRRWRGGSFWGCSNYPKCTFAIFGDIEHSPCARCKAPYLSKKVGKDGTVTLQCGNKECGYQQITSPNGEVTEGTFVYTPRPKAQAKRGQTAAAEKPKAKSKAEVKKPAKKVVAKKTK